MEYDVSYDESIDGTLIDDGDTIIGVDKKKYIAKYIKKGTIDYVGMYCHECSFSRLSNGTAESYNCNYIQAGTCGSDTGLIFRGIDENGLSLPSDIVTLSVPKLKSRLCSEDLCIYYPDGCNNEDNLCILREITKCRVQNE